MMSSESSFKNTVLRNWLKLFADPDLLLSLLNQQEIDFISYYLNHTEERENSIRDQWGNWDFQYNKLDHRHPFLDELIISKLKENKISQRKLWPDNSKMAIIFSHDM